jgi:hypothetical protein
MSPRRKLLCSLFPFRGDRVDERVILAFARVCGNGRRLPVRLSDESRCGDIWNPNLYWPQTSLTQSVAMVSDTIAT